MRVLIIKTSSLGDVVHTLPALTDAANALESITFDWVVEEAFAEIPKWHPAVDNVIPVAIRRWRKTPIKIWSSIEWKTFRQSIKERRYDYIIDAQGLLKSSLLTRLAYGTRVGYDKQSVKEKIASFFYHKKISVAKDQHAVERIRQLFSKTLDYPLPEGIGHYQLDVNSFHTMAEHEPFIMFLHGTTRADKHWPETYWKKLALLVVEHGYHVRIPWGNEVEKQRAESIAELHDNIIVLPRLNLQGVAEVLVEASAVVAVDTGLGHLSAALSIPTISLYGSTDPKLIGAYGDNQIHLKASDFQSDDAGKLVNLFSGLTAAVVWESLQKILE